MIHCRFLHRDIKGGNFTIGRNSPKFIYMIDFGMCRKFVDKEVIRDGMGDWTREGTMGRRMCSMDVLTSDSTQKK